MRFSLQVYYAVCGVFDLAYNGFDTPVQVRVVGERQAIPTRYLEQIFQRLRRAQIVRGKRGPGGGYVLARSPDEISLRDVVEAVEGSLERAAVPTATSRRASSPAPEVAPETRPDFVWPALAARFGDALDAVSLADLCRDAAAQGVPRADNEAYSYQI